jgi:hypothetical protein
MRIAISLALALILLLPGEGRAQDEEGSVDIGDVGSSRIGGPGLTEREKAWNDDTPDPDDEPMTEETLPPVGNKKRIPGLHKLAKQYSGGQMWKDACEKYDQIIEEAGETAILEVEPAKKMAGKSYVECARIAFTSTDFDKAEKMLAKSEKIIGSDHRHAGLRRKMLRESYRKKVTEGDVSGAIKLFNQLQAEEKNEDERIWLGEQLATRARAAHDEKDEITRNEMMRYLAEVAPMNTEYRRLKEELETNQSILTNALMFALGAVAIVFALGWFTKWRASAKLAGEGGGGGGKRNKFLDEDI